MATAIMPQKELTKAPTEQPAEVNKNLIGKGCAVYAPFDRSIAITPEEIEDAYNKDIAANPLHPTSKFNLARVSLIVNAIGRCAPYETAAGLAGVDRECLRDWWQRHLHFYALCVRAETNAELEHVEYLNKNPDWRARAWIMERRWRSRWGEQLAVTGADGGPVQILGMEMASKYTPRQLAEIAETGAVIDTTAAAVEDIPTAAPAAVAGVLADSVAGAVAVAGALTAPVAVVCQRQISLPIITAAPAPVAAQPSHVQAA